jgi:hypothetical protein
MPANSEVVSCIKELSKDELLELLFDYSNYVIEQLENDNQPCCVMEYYENDWELV